MILAAALTLALPAAAHAASAVDVGGYHESAFRAAQQHLMNDPAAQREGLTVGGIRITVDAGETSALTHFTPRFGGLGMGVSAPGDVDYGALLKARLDEPAGAPARRGVRVGPEVRPEIAGLEVEVAAVAELDQTAATTADAGPAFLVGGQLAVSGVRFDAAFGQDPGLLGLAGNRVTAGLGYQFGPLDARVSYSLVDGVDETAPPTSLFTLGSQLTLRPGLVVGGDLAYAESETGTPTTAGLVSLRFSF